MKACISVAFEMHLFNLNSSYIVLLSVKIIDYVPVMCKTFPSSLYTVSVEYTERKTYCNGCSSCIEKLCTGKLNLYKRKVSKKHDNIFTFEKCQKYVIKCMSLVAGFGSYN